MELNRETLTAGAAVAGVWAFVYFYLELKSLKAVADYAANMAAAVIEKILYLTAYFVETFTTRLAGSIADIGEDIL